jgi:hypothetical protein
VLGFLERRHGSGPGLGGGADPPPPFAGALAPLSLQFQPHLPHPSDAAPPGFGPFQPAGGPLPAGAVPAFLHAPAPSFLREVPVGGGAQRPLPPHPAPSAPAGGGGGGSARREGKPAVSHSTVEKQRRDRINSLIDELRELVPPQGSADADAPTQPTPPPGQAPGAGVESGKRPKHVVLADTITLVRELQGRLAADERQLARLHDHTARCPFHTLGDCHASGMACRAGEGAGAAAHVAQLQLGPGGAGGAAAAALARPPSPEGEGESVEVEPGAGCLYVKVHCRDRHGLLADIVRALKATPCEITSAAITTTARGNVYDVFQVTPAPGTPTALVDEIRSSVADAMTGRKAAEKKRRAE